MKKIIGLIIIMAIIDVVAVLESFKSEFEKLPDGSLISHRVKR